VELKDTNRLNDEAKSYTDNFIKEENSGKLSMGISNWETNRSFVYAIEAARNLCGGKESAEGALRLLKVAVKDVTEALAITETGGL
jgi:hypothetical protein